MAVQVDPPGQLQEFLDILRQRVWQIVLPTLFSVSLGVGFAVVVPKKYEVTTQVELRETLLGVGGVSGRNLSLSAREAE
ncbi:MAG: Wzz/FepE/Etk N-terminal domain-containing protein, partial [Planctomycetota bacterium]|nr:Wzz/FepE/Etk N-terminal domain-containing protein [Planctomycetota bacterium]